MGYSCTAKAAYVRDAISELISKTYPEVKSSNGMPDGGFWEVGRENYDGAITGTVWKPWPEDPTRVVRRGGFKIDADGKVVRFPGLPRKILALAEKEGDATYIRNHVRTW